MRLKLTLELVSSCEEGPPLLGLPEALSRTEMPQLDSANGNEHALQFDCLEMAKLHRMQSWFHRLTESKQSNYSHAGELTESFFNAI